MVRTLVVVVAAGAMSVACHGALMKHQVQELAPRAAFELECPPEQLTFQYLGDYDVMGVTGCDGKAVYVNIGGDWFLDSEKSAAVSRALIEQQRQAEEEERRKREEEEQKKREEEERHDQNDHSPG